MNLTSLRFFAAFAVVLFHIGLPTILADAPAPIFNIFSMGYLGVGLFFLLSGYILTYVYSSRKTTIRDFLVARVARIYPLYLLALIVAAPIFIQDLLEGKGDASAFFLSPILLQAWYPPAAATWNGPGWSLSVELFFYVTFLFLLKFFLKKSKKILSFSLLLAWLMPLVTVAALMVFNSETILYTRSTESDLANFIKYNPIMHLGEFIAGICSFLLLRDNPKILRPKILAMSALALIILVSIFNVHVPYLILHTGLLIPLFIVLITTLAQTRIDFLSRPSMILLGNASYAIYLLHDPLWRWLLFIIDKILKINIPVEMLFILYVPIMIAISILSYKYIEVPAKAKILQRFSKRNDVERQGTRKSI